MIIGILGTIIGLLVLGTAIYYLVTDKEENSKKIYGIFSAIGAVIAAISIIVLISNIV